jgi:hypothetical protein
LEDLGVGGRMILKWIFRKWDWETDWIDVAQNRESRSAVANATMNFPFQEIRRIS